jgi:type IV pilus assembly protein PilQ
MMRNTLILISILGYLSFLTSCVSDSNAPAGSDDDIAAAAGEESGAAAPSDNIAAGDDLGDIGGNDAPPTDDLSSELDGKDQSVAKNAGAGEDNLENELDSSDSSQLDGDIAKQDEPPAGPVNDPVIDTDNLDGLDTPAAPAQKAQITNVRYLANQAGGTIVIEATGPLTYHARNEGAQFIIEVDSAELPAKLRHPYPLRDATGAFRTLQVEPNGSGVRVVVQMKSVNNGQPIVQNEGNSLLVVPASAPMVADNTPSPSATSTDINAPPRDGSPLAALTLDEFLTGNQHFYGKPISIQTKDADVRDVVNFIAEESGANIVMSDEVKGKISVKIRRIPWDQALVSVMRAKKLGYVRQGNVIRISSMTELQEETDAAAKMIEAQKNLAPVRVKVIPVNYASVDDLAKQVPAFLSKEGKVVTDQRSNTILVTDRETVLDKVERIIKALDVQPNQVIIEGKIVEASETFSSFIGVNWGMSGSPLTVNQTGGAYGSQLNLTPNLNAVSVSPAIAAGSALSTGIQLGTLDFFGNLSATLSLAESDSVAKIISSPRIATLNREKATISQAGETITISTTVNGATNQSTTQANRTPITLDLTVTPQITADSSVIMDMEVKRQYVGAVVDPNTQAAPINTRTAKTKVLVRNGQTAVIGGIYQNDETNGEVGVPGLKDIPVLGWLFKSRTKTRNKNELLIFLTPRIMQTQTAQME